MRDLTNIKFGRTTVVCRAGTSKYGNALWKCKCDCGSEHIVSSPKLIQGKTKSCGCLALDIRSKLLSTHGLTKGGKKPRTFIIWNGMKARCLNQRNISYSSYGGRGIKICDEWLEFENFHNWALNNGYKKGLTIDRIDNNGNYEPSNCRWISSVNNKKDQRKTMFITANGITDSLSGWSKRVHITRSTLTNVLKEDGMDAAVKFLERKML